MARSKLIRSEQTGCVKSIKQWTIPVEKFTDAAESLPDLSRGTVYATLAEFSELGLLSAYGAPEQIIMYPTPGYKWAQNLAQYADGNTTPVRALFSINATLYSHLNFDFMRDIAPVICQARLTYMVVVHPSFPATTIPEHHCLLENFIAQPPKCRIE